MNLIYNGEMKPWIEGISQPDWLTIEERITPFGDPGREILLRAKTVHYYNAQDWESYCTVASEYLEKYGTNLPENERKMFSEALGNGKEKTR